MMSRHPVVAIGELSVLRKADLNEVQSLRSCYDDGGSTAFYAALDSLCDRDVACYIRLMRAILPAQIRHALREDALDRDASGELDELLRRFQTADGEASMR